MDTIDQTDLRRRLGADPIPGDSATGRQLFDEPEWDRLQAEMAKMESDGPGAVDWTIVLRSGETLLRTASKDMKVACWYGFALFRREGYAGLAVALTILRDMVARHWDGLFPPTRRVRARIGQLEWLSERIGSLVQQDAPAVGEGPFVRECFALLDEIDRLMGEKGADADLGALLHPLRSLDRDYAREEEAARARDEQAGQAAASPAAAPSSPPPVQRAEPARPELPAAATAPAAPPSQASSPPAPAVNIDAPTVAAGAGIEQVEVALASAAPGLKSVAKAMLAIRLSDPRPYELLRLATWIVLSKPPPHQNGRTPLMSPPPDRIRALNEMVASGNFQDAVPQVEASFGNAMFWLDAHRLTATALDGLGTDHAEARRTVTDALAGFLRRFPGLVDLKFQNDVPFADPLTRSWIESEVLATPGGGTAAAAEPWQAAAGEARRLAGQGKVSEAAGLFTSGRRQADGERARLMWELAQARFCTEIDNLPVAVSVLEYLDDQIEGRGLEAWEPEAALEATSLLLGCYRRMPAVPAPVPGQPVPQSAGRSSVSDESRRNRIAKLQARLCRLDVAQALTLLKT